MKILIEVTQDELDEMELSTIDDLALMFYESELNDDLVGYDIRVLLD